jgi:hypothetical protein
MKDKAAINHRSSKAMIIDQWDAEMSAEKNTEAYLRQMEIRKNLAWRSSSKCQKLTFHSNDYGL